MPGDWKMKGMLEDGRSGHAHHAQAKTRAGALFPRHGGKAEPGHASHAGGHGGMEEELRKRFLVCLALSLPLLAISPTVQSFFGLSFTFPGRDLLLFVLATAIIVYGGVFFFEGAAKEIRRRAPGMDVLVSLALVSGYLYSVGATFLLASSDYYFYWEIATLTVFLLFGHWVQMRALARSGDALRELASLIPPMANLVGGGTVTPVETASLKKGDVVLVRPGEKIPVDGVVVFGSSHVNESMMTGESRPIPKRIGLEVIGGSLNIDGSLSVRVTRTGKETAIAQMMELVREAQESKPAVQLLADKAAQGLTIIAISAGAVAFAYWLAIGGGTLLFAVTAAVTVLVIACPHALGLAIPAVTTISTSLAARGGMLVRNARAFESAEKISAVVFDKTGTLTRGDFGVTDAVPVAGARQGGEALLALAASVEESSEHVIAKAIVAHARKQGAKVPKAADFKSFAGEGAKAKVAGEEVLVGNKAFMGRNGVETEFPAAEGLSSQGKTVIYVGKGGRLLGVIALSDSIREKSREAVESLKRQGIEVYMVTGDRKEAAAYVAGSLGLTSYFADVLPEDKEAAIRGLQARGKVVAMVGDGVNDAPALARADVGIAIGSGTDVAVQSADVVLVKNDPRDVAKLIRLSRHSMRKMRENLVWATAYNAVAIPVAAGALHPWGFDLMPEWAALVMAASSIIVVANALLLQREAL